MAKDLHTQIREDLAAYGHAFLLDGERVAPDRVVVYGHGDFTGKLSGEDVMRADPLRARRHRSQGARRVFG